MADKRMRFVEFERGEIDMETGEFPMILATDGEASDGDILSIEGAQYTSRAPLQISHINDPRDTLGTVSGFRRDLKSSPKMLRARGQIELGGDGPSADIRRDLAYMIQQGHVTGISVRWEPVSWQRRADLPKEHPAYVDPEKEKDPRKRYGLYFDKWRVMEGSVVAIQADKQAMIGRSEETEGHVSAFWRAMADDAKPAEEIVEKSDEIAIEAGERFSENHVEKHYDGDGEAPEAEEKPEAPSREAQIAAFAAQLREFRETTGIEYDALAEVFESERPKSEQEQMRERVELQKVVIEEMQKRLASLEGRVQEGAPAPPIRNVAQIYDRLSEKLAERNQRILKYVEDRLKAETGKVEPAVQSAREAARTEVARLVKEAREQEQDRSDIVRAVLASMNSILEESTQAQ